MMAESVVRVYTVCDRGVVTDSGVSVVGWSVVAAFSYRRSSSIPRPLIYVDGLSNSHPMERVVEG